MSATSLEGYTPVNVNEQVVGYFKITRHGPLFGLFANNTIDAILKKVQTKWDAQKQDATWLLNESLSQKPLLTLDLVCGESQVQVDVSERGIVLRGDLPYENVMSFPGAHLNANALMLTAKQTLQHYAVRTEKTVLPDGKPDIYTDLKSSITGNLYQAEKVMMSLTN